jgi:PilZ domain
MAEAKSSVPAANAENNSDRRRSHRVHIMMPVLVRGTKGTQQFEEQTVTISVNAHGCMVRLATAVTRNQGISIINPKTAEELPCTVTFLGPKEGGKTEVGIEFAEPSPVFWRIAFPPENWDPTERKRPGSPRPPATSKR